MALYNAFESKFYAKWLTFFLIFFFFFFFFFFFLYIYIFYSEIPVVLKRKILGVAEENECLGECILGEVCSRQYLATLHVRSFTTANISKIIEIPQNPMLERPCVRIRADRRMRILYFFFPFIHSHACVSHTYKHSLVSYIRIQSVG